ncbi:MAG: hypothetical protein MRY74_07375 [Neomegalonema sp.]|nr:hypothetical protein [Neomegalonema sp.]
MTIGDIGLAACIIISVGAGFNHLGWKGGLGLSCAFSILLFVLARQELAVTALQRETVFVSALLFIGSLAAVMFVAYLAGRILSGAFRR